MVAFSEGLHYVINILAADQQHLQVRFAGKREERWRCVAYTDSARGLSLLEWCGGDL